MKEYIREVYYANEADFHINEIIQEGWEVYKIEEAEYCSTRYAYVWFVREKTLNPQLLSEADDLLKAKNR